MSLKLMYITNDPEIAKIVEKSGVDWIFIDLEIVGKEERQGHLDTVISRHQIEDVKRVKNILNNSKLLVRVNPIYEGSKNEIDKVIDDGADIVMLPFFKTKEEVEAFVNITKKKTKTMLLLETPEAVENLDDILTVEGIDYIHIGLNDLHLGYKKKFMFELLIDGTVETICKKIKNVGIPFGFGGIAQLGKGDLPAENIITEHYRLGSSMAILSRSFCNNSQVQNLDTLEKIFLSGIKEIRNFEDEIISSSQMYFEKNRTEVVSKVLNIVSKL